MREIVMRTLKFGSRLAVAAAVVLVAASLSTPTAQAAPDACGYTTSGSTYSPSGTYGGAFTGQLDGQSYDAVLLGTFSYSNPTASFSGTLVYSMAGSPGSSTTLSGSWTIAAACTGTLSISSPAGLSFVVYYNPGLSTIQLAESDTYGEMSTTLKKMSSTTCTSSSANGTWAGTWNGALSGQQYNGVMVSTFGTGSFSGALTYNLVGVGTGTANEAGTVTELGTSSSCIGTLSVSTGGLSFAILVNAGNQISIAETDGSGLMAHNESVLGF